MLGGSGVVTVVEKRMENLGENLEGPGKSSDETGPNPTSSLQPRQKTYKLPGRHGLPYLHPEGEEVGGTAFPIRPSPAEDKVVRESLGPRALPCLLVGSGVVTVVEERMENLGENNSS